MLAVAADDRCGRSAGEPTGGGLEGGRDPLTIRHASFTASPSWLANFSSRSMTTSADSTASIALANHGKPSSELLKTAWRSSAEKE